MRRFLAWVGISLLSLNGCAAEPVNLNYTKQALIEYHDSGRYMADIQSVVNQAMSYLQARIQQKNFGGKKPAIILDIDETSLSNYSDLLALNFGGTPEEIALAEDRGQDLPILPTLRLFQFAKQNKIAVFFVTGRHDYERNVTLGNLFRVGYRGFDGLFLRTPNYYNATAIVYKTNIRQQIAQQGYDILLSLGDQVSDLKGGFADQTFKLPNPYYFIP